MSLEAYCTDLEVQCMIWAIYHHNGVHTTSWWLNTLYHTCYSLFSDCGVWARLSCWPFRIYKSVSINLCKIKCATNVLYDIIFIVSKLHEGRNSRPLQNHYEFLIAWSIPDLWSGSLPKTSWHPQFQVLLLLCWYFSRLCFTSTSSCLHLASFLACG